MKNKKLHLELLRIIACFFVIFNHTGANGYELYAAYPTQSMEYWLYMIPSVLCKVSVPMFFAISGSLLIDREESLPVIFKKRVLKLVIVLFVFSLFYYLVSLDNLGEISAYNFFGTLYTYTWNFSFWYLYSFLIFLLCLPFIRALAKNLKDSHFYYLFGIAIVFDSLLPIAEYLLWKGEHSHYGAFSMSWATATLFLYPCLGYFIEKRLDITKMKKWLLPLWVLNIAGILISCYMTFFRSKVTGNSTEAFFSSFVMVNVSTLFISAKYFYTVRSTKTKRSKGFDGFVATVGGCTFGIYLLHVFFLHELPAAQQLWTVLLDSWALNPMISALIVCLAVFTVCCVITLIMKKIPLLNRLI